ncbi:MAG: KEOPS complex subunit Cgi121 [Promethearchaeota archaeon]
MKIYFIKASGELSHYYIGINQIEIGPKKVQINDLVELIENVHINHNETVLQFFNEEFVLNFEHILHACYFVQKTFNANINISKTKNLELLLYLAANRQIKLSLEAFGVKDHNFQNKKISFCIISSEDNIKRVNIEINEKLSSKDIALDFENLSVDKYNRIKKYFKFSDKQILTVLRSYGYISDEEQIKSLDFERLYEALNDLISEKMALLSLEKA